MASGRPRRLVTGLDGQGKSRVVSDGPSPAHFELPGTRFDVIWRIKQPPVAGNAAEPVDLDHYSMQPPPGVATWVVLEIPPEGEPAAAPDSPDVAASRERFDDAGVFEEGGEGWHRTDTLDLVTVLEGEVDLELDDGVHRLGPGDCVVQNGTRHRWVNRGAAPCRLSGVVIGAATHIRSETHQLGDDQHDSSHSKLSGGRDRHG